jgi:hypothetical protein
MFMTSWYYALLAMGMAGCIYKYIEYRGLVTCRVGMTVSFFRGWFLEDKIALQGDSCVEQ